MQVGEFLIKATIKRMANTVQSLSRASRTTSKVATDEWTEALFSDGAEVIGETLTDLNRCANALERIAQAMEDRNAHDGALVYRDEQ